MDTWENINSVKNTRAWRRYVGQEKRARNPKPKKGSDVQAREEEGTSGSGQGRKGIPGEFERATRLEIFRRRKGYGLHKGTDDKLYSVWMDSEPIGNGRCRKTGPLHATCAACLITSGVRT